MSAREGREKAVNMSSRTAAKAAAAPGASTPEQEDEAATPDVWAKFALALPEEYQTLDASVEEVEKAPGFAYIGFLHPKTRVDQAEAVTEAMGAVPHGQAYLRNGDEFIDPGKRASVLLAEFRCWADYSWGDGPKLEEASLEDPGEGSDLKECYIVLTLTLGQTVDEAPVVAVSRMLKSQCAWVSDVVTAIKRAAKPETLAKVSTTHPALGAALTKVPPRFRVAATIRGRLKGSGDSAYAQTRARAPLFDANNWPLLGAALADPETQAAMAAGLDEFRARRDELIEKSREERPKAPAASRRARR